MTQSDYVPESSLRDVDNKLSGCKDRKSELTEAAVPSPPEVALLAMLLGRVGPRRTAPGASRKTHQIKSNTDQRRSTSVGAGIGRATA